MRQNCWFLSLILKEKTLLGLCYNTIEKGVLAKFCVFVVQRAEKKLIWNLWFLGFCPAMAVRDHQLVLFFGLLKPIFYSVWGVRGFWAKLSKMFFEKETRTLNILTDN